MKIGKFSFYLYIRIPLLNVCEFFLMRLYLIFGDLFDIFVTKCFSRTLEHYLKTLMLRLLIAANIYDHT